VFIHHFYNKVRIVSLNILNVLCAPRYFTLRIN